MYALVIKPEFGISRDQLMARLREEGIDTRTFFCPMNQQPCFQSQPGFREVSCPVADKLWETGLYLPSSCTLTEETIQSIGQSIQLAAAQTELKTIFK
jgi:perosamine synthetase